jgi:hypothetical protein
MTDQESPQCGTGAHKQDLLKAALLAFVSFLVYWLTRTRHFGGDDTVFALVVQRWLEKGVFERAFFHPHHLLYNPLVALCSWLVREARGSVFVLDVGAVVSAAAGAAAVAGVYLVMRRLRIDDNLALAASAVLAVTGGMWRYATRMEVYTLAAVGVVVWLAAMSNERASWRGLAGGFAAPWLGHSALGLLVPPGAWVQRSRPRVVAIALAAGVLVPGVMAGGLLAWIHGARSVSSLMTVVVGSGSGRWLSFPDPVAAMRALGSLVALRVYHALPVYSLWAMNLFDALAVLATAVLAVLVVWGAYVSIRDGFRLGVTAALGVGFMVPLWLVWDVGNHEHAVAALPLFVVLATYGAAAAGRRLGTIMLAVIAAILVVVNGVGSVLLETQPHLSRTLLAADLVRETIPEDGTLVMVGVDPELRLALPHLGGRRTIDLTALVHSAHRAGATPQEALDRWLHRASTADSTWMLEDPDSPPVQRWVAKLGIQDEMWRDARSRLRLGKGATLAADDIVVHERITIRPVDIESRP